MTGAGFLDVWKVEVQQLGHTLSVDLLTDREMNPGTT